MSFSDTSNAKKYASIAEVAAAQAKVYASELESAPDYAAQAAASAAAAATSESNAVAAESIVNGLAISASESATSAAASAASAGNAASAAIGRSVKVPDGETLGDLPAAADRQSSLVYFDELSAATVKPISDFAILDENGKIPVSVIPAIALTEPFVVDSQAEMLALDAQVGDIAKRTDLGYSFCLASAPPSTLSNWVQLTDDVLAQLGQSTGAASVGALNDAGSPTTVQLALNAKANKATLLAQTGATTIGASDSSGAQTTVQGALDEKLPSSTDAFDIPYGSTSIGAYLAKMDVYLETYLLVSDATINRAMNAIFTAFPSGARVIFPHGASLVAECLNNKIFVPSNYELHGNGCTITAFKNGVSNVESIFTIAKGLTDATYTPSNNVYIHDFILDGNFTLADNRVLFRNQSLIGFARAPGSSAATETLISRNVKLERIQFKNCAWGISGNAVVNFDLLNCYFEGLIYTGDDGVTTENVSGGYGINIGNCRNVNIHGVDAKATTGAERHLIYITAGNYSVSIRDIHVDWALAGSTRGTGTCPPINIRAVNRLIIDGYQVIASSTYTNCFLSFNGDSGISYDVTITNVEATGAKDDGIVIDNVFRFNVNNVILTDVSSPSTTAGSTGIRLQLAQQGNLDNILIQGSNLNSGFTIRSGCDKITTGDNIEIRNTNKLAGITYRGFVFATHTISYSPGSEYSGLPSTNIRIGRIRWSGLDYTFYDTTASLYAGKVALTHPAIGVMKVVAGVITEVQDSYGILSWGQHSAGASVVVSQYFPADMTDYGVSLTVQDTIGTIRSAFPAMTDASAKRWVLSLRTSADAYVDATTLTGLRIVFQLHQLGGL